MPLRLLPLSLAVFFLAACSSSGNSDDTVCDPTEALTRACTCEDGQRGVQTCTDHLWSACVEGSADGDLDTDNAETEAPDLELEKGEDGDAESEPDTSDAPEADSDSENASETASEDGDSASTSEAVSEDGDSESTSEAVSEDGDADSESEMEDTSGLPSFPPTRVIRSDNASDWVERFGNTGDEWSQDLLRLPNGDLILLGYYDGKIEFDSGFLLPVAGMPVPGFFAHFNAQGRTLSGKDLSADFTTTSTSVLSVSKGPLDRLFFSSLVPNSPDGDLRLLVRGYDADGMRLTAFESLLPVYTTASAVLAMAVDDSGAVYIADTAAVRKLDTAGRELWSLATTYDDGYWADMQSIIDGTRHFQLIPKEDGSAALWGITQQRLLTGGIQLMFSERSGVFRLTVSALGGFDGFSATASSQDAGALLWGSDVVTSATGESFRSFACADTCATTLASDSLSAGPGALLEKFAADGSATWLKATSDKFVAGDTYPVALDGNGTLFQAGGGSIRKIDDAGNVMGFVEVPSWFKVRTLRADEAGGVYAAGSFTGTVYLFGGALDSAGGSDVFLAHFSTFPAPNNRLQHTHR